MVRLRPAEPGDAGLLFDWVNQPDSLAGKIQTSGPIPWQVHQAWFARSLSDDATTIWIIEVDGRPAGQVRISRNDDWNDVDIYLAAAYRGHGLAQAALAAVVECVRHRTGRALRLRALVKPGNTMSQKLFERAGFDRQTSAPDHVAYVLTNGSGGLEEWK